MVRNLATFHWALSHFWPLMRDRERLRRAIHDAAVLPLGELFRASIGSGYFRSQPREVSYIPPNATVPGGYPADYVVESVPLTGRVDYLATESVPVVSLGVAVEMHILTVTRRIHTQPALENGDAERSVSATVPGWSMTVGIEWPVNQRIYFGVRGGYRFAEGEVPEVPSFESPEQNYRFDVAGPFATVLIRVHPWHRNSKN